FGNSDCQINATLTSATLPLHHQLHFTVLPRVWVSTTTPHDRHHHLLGDVRGSRRRNLTVFITLFRNRHRKSRVNLMIMHLAAADLMVTLINFPLGSAGGSRQWVAGNLACKLFQFLGPASTSSLVLVCISLDRYFAIVHRSRLMMLNDVAR
ncbi:C-X-C chemokine receptor type 5-like, partial [Homarus americanus]